MIRITKLYSDGREVVREIPETHTLVLRGGQEFQLDETRVDPAGDRKREVYGTDRYLRDGAQSFAVYPIAEGELPAWRKLAKRIPKGFNVVEEKGKSPVLHINSAGITKLGAIEGLGELPDGSTQNDMGAFVEGELNAHALTHAGTRADALYSGIIPEGKSGGAQPELAILRGYAAEIMAAQRGITKSAAVKLVRVSASVGELRAWFVDGSGFNAPERLADAGAWFDELQGKAEALVEFERTQRGSILS